jgi:flagellar hook-associated protein 3 FlgL
VADSTSVLNAGVSALQDVNDVLVRARQIAIEGADSTTGSDPTSREALAIELDGLITQALQIANSQPDGKAVFGGTAIDSPPFRVATLDANGRPATIAYDGAAERTRSLIGVGQTVDTRYAGNTVFQQPGADVFQSLIALRDDLRNPTFNDAARSQALNTRLTELTAARDAIGDVMGEKSSNLANLESLGNLLTDLKLTADIRTGELAGTDYADAVVKMQEQESALQAIYAVSAKLLEPSLLDFIR